MKLAEQPQSRFKDDKTKYDNKKNNTGLRFYSALYKPAGFDPEYAPQ